METIEKYKIILEISKRYNLNFKDINIDDSYHIDGVNYLGKIDEYYDLEHIPEPIYWFKYKNKKYIMKEQLEIISKIFTEQLSKQIVEEINFDPTAYNNRLFEFWRNENNNLNYFPKFLDEDDNFFIFEYIEGNPLYSREDCLPYMKEYFEINKDIIKHTKNFRPTNLILWNWLITKDGLKYVNLRRFVLAVDLKISVDFGEGPEYEF